MQCITYTTVWAGDGARTRQLRLEVSHVTNNTSPAYCPPKVTSYFAAGVTPRHNAAPDVSSQRTVLTHASLLSGKPGSNRPPQPWQDCALPNELFPHFTHFRLTYSHHLEQSGLEPVTTLFRFRLKRSRLFNLYSVCVTGDTGENWTPVECFADIRLYPLGHSIS